MTTSIKRRKTGGRKPGSLNKTTHEMRALAQKHGGLAIATLVDVMTKATSESARVAAANSILDRAYGKPAQCLEVEETVTANISAMDGLSEEQKCARLGITPNDFNELKRQLIEYF